MCCMYLCVCVVDGKRCGVESSSVDDDDVANVSHFFWKCLNMVILDTVLSELSFATKAF